MPYLNKFVKGWVTMQNLIPTNSIPIYISRIEVRVDSETKYTSIVYLGPNKDESMDINKFINPPDHIERFERGLVSLISFTKHDRMALSIVDAMAYSVTKYVNSVPVEIYDMNLAKYMHKFDTIKEAEAVIRSKKWVKTR